MRQTLCSILIAMCPTLVFAVEIEPRPATSSTVGIQIDGIEDAQAAAEKLAQEGAGFGERRAIEKRRQVLDGDELLQRRLEGKMDQVDVLSGTVVYDHVTDYLPENWGKRYDFTAPVDSLGNPIVNTAPGLPGWAEHNIEALTTEIRQSLAKLDAAADQDRAEYEAVLGNFVGQALVRGLDVSSVIALNDDRISANVAESIVNQLHFYENLKVVRAEGMGYSYTKSAYSDDVVGFVEAAGHSMEQVLEVSTAQTKATPSGWYNMSTFTRGMTNLPGGIIIWSQSDDDDAAADVPISWRWYFYPLDDPDFNLNVRVSTNGYISFFEQGGGAEDGIDYSNDAITNTIDPDGYIAPSWDDYFVAPAQGSPDSVSYLTEGALGARVFTVQWYSVSHLGGVTTDFHYFQVKLFEATGNIELHTGTIAPDSSDSSTVGMEDFGGVNGDCGPNCLYTNTTATIPDNYMFAPNRPANNAWNNAICVAADAPVAGSSFGATPDNPPIVPTCGTSSIHDVWYWYHSPATGNVTFDTCTGTSFDTVLGVFDDTQAEIGCNDDGCGVQSSVVVAAGSNQDYRVRVSGFNSRQGDFALTATPTSTPNGDYCANAWTVGTGSAQWNNNNNTGCIDQSSCGFNDTIDEWFSWTAPGSGLTTVTTCDPVTDFDTTLTVFSSCGGAEITCSDDDFSCLSGVLQSTTEFMATSGSTYFFRIAGYSYAHGNYQLSVRQTIVVPLIFSDGFESGNTNAWSSTVP